MADKVPPPVTASGYTNEKSTFWSPPGVTDEDTPELRWPSSVPICDQMRRQDAQIRSAAETAHGRAADNRTSRDRTVAASGRWR